MLSFLNPFNSERNPASPASQKPIETPPQQTDPKISRRNALRGMLSIAAAATLEGCAQNNEPNFFQNFDARVFKPFREDERPRRHELEWSNEDTTIAMSEIVKEHVDPAFPLHELFECSKDAAGQLCFTPRSSSEVVAEALPKYGYTQSAGGWIDQSYYLVARKQDNQAQQTQINAEPNNVAIRSTEYNAADPKHGRIKTNVFSYFEQVPPSQDGARPSSVLTFSVGDFHPETENISTTIIRSTVDGIHVLTTDDGTFIQLQTGERFGLQGKNAYKLFLESCTSNLLIQKGLAGAFPFPEADEIHDIETVDELVNLFRLLPPRDPISYACFLRHGLVYEKNDKSKQDEYRNPVDSIRSGWGDCDDFAVIHFLWAHLEGYDPHITKITKHVFAWYLDHEHQTIVFLDNNNVRIFPQEEMNPEAYTHTYWKGCVIEST